MKHRLTVFLISTTLAAACAAQAPGTRAKGEAVLQQAAQAGKRGDYLAAFKLLKPLAQQGNAVAQNNIAVLYQDGLGVKKNEGEALKWYRKAAEQGLAEAQFDTGLMYARGLGTKQDFAQAAHWYARAAKQGHAEAQNNLAVRYASGTGVARNLLQAKYWFGQAAMRGHPTAAASLRELQQMEQSGKIK